MLRSLIAVIIAVVAGLACAKLVEGGGGALLNAEQGTLAYSGLLGFGWGAGAFVASFVAMFGGKRWAPLGILSAAAILLGAVLTLLSAPMSWFMWPLAIVSPSVGGWGAIRLLNARMQHPDLKKRDGLFDE